MVARSRPSLRRSTRRGDQTPTASPVTEVQASSAVTLSHRTKRNRVSSISENENLRKRRRIGQYDYPSKYKFPLRSRPNNDPLQSIPFKKGTKPVPLIQKEETPASSTIKQQHISHAGEDEFQGQRRFAPLNEKRTLRSQDGGSRSKSELSLYFTNYEQMLSLEASKPDLLIAKTHITLIDDLSISSEHISSPPQLNQPSTIQQNDPFGARKPLHHAQRIDLNPTVQGYSPRRPIKDTLPEDVFHKAHRKAERHEKQLRNIEKERAQHEKVQLDRLLEELKGPDWLKVMGISGVTESEKKLYEPKRLFFIKEVAGLIGKFRHWKEEEKRRKMEREQALLAEEDEAEEDELDEAEGIEGDANDASHQHSSPPPLISHIPPAPPDTHDVDAAAAAQLHHEAISASSHPPPGTALLKKRQNPSASASASLTSPVSPTSPPHLPSTQSQSPGSFFAKRHMRDAALAGHRRGRHKLAFGELVPDPGVEREFELPGSVLTEEMVRARARLRRRLRRGSEE